MTKSDLLLLEKVFAAEISGGMYQSQSKQIKRLEQEGYVVEIEKHFSDRFGTVVCKGYVLTIKGNATYCMSDLCVEAAL